MIFKELSESKIVLIYVYYQRKQEQKNQTNLAFFLKYGLNKENWKHLDITTILVIDKECEVMIPKDIHVIYSNSVYYTDYEGWYDGIQYINTISNVSNYDYLCLMNASTFGPVMEEDTQSHWLYPFYHKMVETDSIACSPYMNYFHYLSHPLNLSCHFTMFKITDDLIPLLIKNHVLGKKVDKIDAIGSGEEELTKILKTKYNVCSLFYDKEERLLDCERREFEHSTNMDRLSKTIFIKNIWRYNTYEYPSKPVLYHYCNTFLNKKMKIKELFTLNSNELDLSRMNITPNFYYEYVYAEEPIVFSKKGTLIEKSCAIYMHEGDILQDYVIKGLKTLVYVGYEVFFYSNASIDPNSLPFPVRKPTTLSSALKEAKGFDWVLYLNSSVLFPIYGVDQFVKTILEARKADVWSHWNKELPFEFKGTMTDSIRTFLDIHNESQLFLFLKNLDLTYIVLEDVFAMKRDCIQDVSPYCNDLTKYLYNDGIVPKEESPPTIDILDWRGYLNLYPDLRKARILTKEGALNHWLKHGRKEGRIMIRTFAWKEYLDNPHLKEAGIVTKEQAVTHWMMYNK